MIVRFDDIKVDAYGRVESPTLFLHTMSGEAICPISNYYGLTTEFRFNDVSELNFSIPDTYVSGDTILHNDSYDEVRGMRIVRMEPFGAFVLLNPSTTNDGIKNIKTCKAYSLEYELNYKTMPPLDGTYMFYDPTGESADTMIDIILESVPNWMVGHIDANVATRYRTFDNNGESIYSFMMNTLQESYSCVFLFDTDKRIINIYDSANAVENVPLFLSNTNLIETLDIEELSDELVTCLSVYGADDTSIITVNPLASDKIYNLDYFIEIGDIPPTLARKWLKWKSDYQLYQGVFGDLFSQLYTAQIIYNAEAAKLTDLSGELDTLEHVLDTYITDVTGDHSTEIADVKEKITAKTAEVNAQSAVVTAQDTKIDSIMESMESITGLCAFDRYFTNDELKQLNVYIKEDSIQESSYAVSYAADTPAVCETIKPENPITVAVSAADLYRSDDYSELTSEEIAQLNLSAEEEASLNNVIDGISGDYLGQNFFKINSGVVNISDIIEDLKISGTVVNSTLSYAEEKNANGNHECMVSFYINDPQSQQEEFLGASNALFVASGELIDFSYNNVGDSENQDTMSFKLVSGIMTMTYDSTIYQRQNTVQDLFNYGVESLNKLAYPSYSFSVDSANFMVLPEFKHLKSKISLGKSMNIQFKDGVFLQPIFIGMKFDFEDATSFTLEFSDKFRSNNPEFPLVDVIGKTAQTTASLDANKFSYSAFMNSNIQNDVENLINSALDISKRAIINADSQDILIDKGGIHLRKLIDKANNRFDPCEVRMINNEIVFTDDAWETAGLAIGKLTVNTDGVDRSVMGIVANSLIGNVIIGNKLTIEATGMDRITGQPNVTHFRVDGGGAYLGNASFAIQGAPQDGIEGNKMIFDPRIGIVAGDNSIFTIGSDGVVPNFIDENGNVVYDSTGVMPAGSSLFFDIHTGNASFRGDVYADNGYFKGALDIGGKFKVDGNGNLEATGAKISGEVNATKLIISSNAQVSGLEVGKNVTMSSNAKISWNNIEGADNVAMKNDIPSDYRITQITKDTLATQSVTATNLTVTGGKINMSTTSDDESFIILNNIQSFYDKYTSEFYGGSLYLSQSRGATLQYETQVSASNITTPMLSSDTIYLGGINISNAINGNFSSVSVSGTITANYFGTSANYATMVHTNNVCIHTSTTTSNAYCGFNSSNYLQKYSGSSMQYKHNIHSLTDELKHKFRSLYDIEVKNWTYNDDYIDTEDDLYNVETFGLIAEDVESVLPEAVVYNKDGTVDNYRDRHLINAILYLIQDQKKEIDQLRTEVNELKGVI